MQVALEVIEEVGAAEFSIRKVATSIGCNPMAILYHFGSKDGLERAMADAINAQLKPPPASLPWQDRLQSVASQYRRVAMRYPNTFPLLASFYVTGPADATIAEHIYRALLDAGLGPKQVAHHLLGFYALIIGLCIAEIRGLLSAPPDEKKREVAALIAENPELWATQKLMPHLTATRAENVFQMTLEAFIRGLQ